MRRLKCLTLVSAVLLALTLRSHARVESLEVNLDYVAKRAEERARKPFKSPRITLPENLRLDQLDYDKYREIRFRHDHALWAADKLPFEVEFFHPGYRFEEPVHINEFSANYVQPIRFVQDFFDYGKLHSLKVPANTGYAGFKVLYALNETNKMDELGAFIGASYYRLLGKDQHYGMSARGLAVDCGEPDRPEEFPIFTDWWLGKPQPHDKELHLFAILDSVSCTGAYEFRIRPGETTVCDVDAVVFLREPKKILEADPKKKPLLTLGLAPLTSMFWFGANSERKFDDYRPQVHDSDGLLVRMENGETLWRPLNNAPVMRHQTFVANNIHGFGLLQRDRNFADYQDMFNLYQMTPSVWVEPRGHWGDGTLHLLELSTQYEGLDNIAAFWDPNGKPAPLQPFRFSYTMYWTRETDMKLSQNKVVLTRVGVDPRNDKWREIIVDFNGPKLDTLPTNAVPEAIASCSTNATIVENQLFRIPFNGDWRAILKMEQKPGNQDPVDLRCTLKKGEEVLTETWTYHWSPP